MRDAPCCLICQNRCINLSKTIIIKIVSDCLNNLSTLSEIVFWIPQMRSDQDISYETHLSGSVIPWNFSGSGRRVFVRKKNASISIVFSPVFVVITSPSTPIKSPMSTRRFKSSNFSSPVYFSELQTAFCHRYHRDDQMQAFQNIVMKRLVQQL